MLRFLQLPERFVVLPEFAKNIPAILEPEIARIWEAEKSERGPGLSNGLLFSVAELSGKIVSGGFVEYRIFLAQLRRPELFTELRVQPLAVTGLLQNTEGIFFGFRSSRSAQQPHCWELVPAGGIDTSRLTHSGQIEPHRQLLAELEEELGLKPSDVRPPRLVGFCEETEQHIFDLVWDLETTLATKMILAAQTAIQNPEHAEIRCVPWRNLEAFLTDSRRAIAAGNRELLRHVAPDKRWMRSAD